MKRNITLLVKASIAGFVLSVPTFIVGNAHGVPECTFLAAPERSHSTSPATSVPLATLAEGFESATFPPPGWTTKSAGLVLPHAWHRTADPDDVGSGRAAAYVGSRSPTAIDEWLMTPVVALGATDKAIKFSWSGSPQWSSVLDGSLNIREAGSTEWTLLWSIAGNESPADPFAYRERFVDLSAWAGMKVQFGFRVAGKNGASFGLDDVAVGDFAPDNEIQLLNAVKCSAVRDHSSANPWKVVTLREPWADDIPFETRTDYLRSSSDRNYVPGPDSLVARVVIVSRRGYVEIVDVVTGESRRLLETPASLPQWSPDGRCLSCVVWKSHLNPYQLTVVDVSASKIVMENDLTDGTESKWSPDSRSIAVSGISRKWSGALLYTVTVPDGRVTVIDSLKVLASHEFSWSPDGRWIAFSRPTRLHHVGDTIAADLWIADAATGESWCMLDGSEWAVMDPLWITNRSIQITRVRWHDEGANEEQRLVVELSYAADSPRQ
jgi:hypothetical protein